MLSLNDAQFQHGNRCPVQFRCRIRIFDYLHIIIAETFTFITVIIWKQQKGALAAKAGALALHQLES